jgi:hypothetical protein
VFGNRVVSRICKPNKEEVIGGCIKLNNKKVHTLYSSSELLGKSNKEGQDWWGMYHAWSR